MDETRKIISSEFAQTKKKSNVSCFLSSEAWLQDVRIYPGETAGTMKIKRDHCWNRRLEKPQRGK